jgi:arsenate reductase
LTKKHGASGYEEENEHPILVYRQFLPQPDGRRLGQASQGDLLQAESAGVATHGLNPYAVRVMAEAGVDISHQQSTLVDGLLDRERDYVVTLCGHAHESCPMFPRQVRKIHVGFDDPAQLAKVAGSEEETLAHFRRVRDEIRAFVEGLPDNLEVLA